MDTQILQLDLLEAEKIGSKVGSPTLKNLGKNRGNFGVLLQLFPFASNENFNFSLSSAIARTPHDIQNVDFIIQQNLNTTAYRVSKKSVPSKRIFYIFFKIF